MFNEASAARERGAYSFTTGKIVELVLRTPRLFARWKEEIQIMAGRIKKMRAAVRNTLIKLGTPGNWDHIVSQIGMFSFTGLNKKQCELMMSKYNIYLLTNGRISMAGLNTRNVRRFAESVDAVVREA